MSSTAPDGISSLPDAVLCHILSFLPTKLAVATSVLSKRWKHIWCSVPALNFDIVVEDQETNFRFNEFVYSVLLSQDSIKSFRLKIRYGMDLGYLGFPNVIKWVNYVVQRQVEYLHLDVFMFAQTKLPISILSCRTLVVLKLDGFTLEGFSSVGLPSLKILHLKDSQFLKVGDFLLLLAGCPILEDLQADRIVLHSEETLNDREWKNLSLSKLNRADMVCCYCHFPLTALYNVEFLCIEINKMYRCYNDIPTFHNLTHLELHTLNCNWHLLVQLLKHCPKLENLDLNQATVDGYRQDVQENWVDPQFVPQCLSLHLRTCTLQEFLDLPGELLLARYILKNAKVLQTMTIWTCEPLEIERKLSSCPRASATCRLSVYPLSYL